MGVQNRESSILVLGSLISVVTDSVDMPIFLVGKGVWFRSRHHIGRANVVMEKVEW